MKLSDVEREVIRCTQLNADASCPEIARLLGRQVWSVRHTLNSLLERRVIRPVPLLNFSPLGLREHYIYFSLYSDKVDRCEALLRQIQESEHVTWMLRLGGKYDYVMLVLSHSNTELWNFLDALSEKSGPVFKSTSIGLIVSRNFFPRKYLHPTTSGVSHIQLPEHCADASLDELDHRILQAIGNEADLSLSGVARRAQIPHSTCTYRIQRLKERGILAALVFSCPRIIEGIQRYRLHLKLRAPSIKVHTNLLNFARSHPFFTTCHQTIGEYDAILEIEVEHAERLASILHELGRNFGDIAATIDPVSVLGSVKNSNYPIRNFSFISRLAQLLPAHGL